MNNKEIIKCQFSKRKKELINKIQELLNIQQVKLISYFDDKDSFFYELGQKNGLYLNISYLGRGPFKENELTEVFDHGNYDHLIWISKEISECEEIDLVWTYSHELQHLIHALEDPNISIISDYIWKVWGKMDYTKHWLELPNELDCEKTAKKITEIIFDKQICKNYIEKKFGLQFKAKLDYLKNVISNNIYEELKKIIIENKFIYLKFENEISKEYNINIDIAEFIN